MATKKQVDYLIHLLNGAGYSTRYMDSSFKALGAKMKERSGKVEDWLKGLSTRQASSLIDQLRDAQPVAEDMPEAGAAYPVTVESSDSLSNRRFHALGGNRGRRSHWWLLDRRNDEFIDIPRMRGDRRFQADLSLEPGKYTLGVGDRTDIRETIVVQKADPIDEMTGTWKSAASPGELALGQLIAFSKTAKVRDKTKPSARKRTSWLWDNAPTLLRVFSDELAQLDKAIERKPLILGIPHVPYPYGLPALSKDDAMTVRRNARRTGYPHTEARKHEGEYRIQVDDKWWATPVFTNYFLRRKNPDFSAQVTQGARRTLDVAQIPAMLDNLVIQLATADLAGAGETAERIRFIWEASPLGWADFQLGEMIRSAVRRAPGGSKLLDATRTEEIIAMIYPERVKAKANPSKVQSLVFDRNLFNGTDARNWALANGFDAPKIHTTKNTIRIRQYPPKKGAKYRTIKLTDGVQATLDLGKR